MNILVCVNNTPDTTAKIAFTAGNTKFAGEGVSYILNPYDEWYSLVRAIELQEKFGGKVTVIHVGPASSDTNLRKALAIGADEAVRIDSVPLSAAAVATAIAAYAKDKAYDLIFTGKESIDYQSAEVGAMIAEHLDWPFIGFANKLDVEGTTATVQREVEGALEVIQVGMPVVVSSAKGMAEQRIPNMRGIMMAKSKPLQVITPPAIEELLTVKTFTLPPPKSGVKMVEPGDMSRLVQLIHEETKVI